MQTFAFAVREVISKHRMAPRLNPVFRVIRFHAVSGTTEELTVTSDAQTALDAAGTANRGPGEFVIVEAACPD